MPYLKEHIRKTWVAANAGDEVFVIADHGNVQIVADKDGIRFPVKTEILSQTIPDEIPPAPISKEVTTQRKKGSRASKKLEQSLFD